MTHTPTPWFSEGRPPNMVLLFSGKDMGNRKSPCILLADDDQAANAAFIVRAVNCHDELVEALTNARRIILALDSSLVDGPNMNFINALLAKESLPAVRGGAK